MNVTIIGAGNSGLAMAAHISMHGNNVTLWNRSRTTIAKLIETHKIHSEGLIDGFVEIERITDDLERAIDNTDIILITTPANSHKELAVQIAHKIKKETVIVLNPGRTFGALEFHSVYSQFNRKYKQTIAEAQTIIYTCRRTGDDSVKIIALKSDVLLSTFDANKNKDIIGKLPACVQEFFVPAKSMIETSIGNVGMILHCAPLLLNAGWTESERSSYKYYYDGITPTVGKLIDEIDMERVAVSEALGHRVESTKEWLIRTYHVTGENIYECIQNNEAYEMIDAPKTLDHRYIFEDVPCGLVPLESIGTKLGLKMEYTALIIDLASKLMNVDFRKTGRNLESLGIGTNKNALKTFLGGQV